MSDMLRYQFNDMTKTKVALKDDIRFLTDFLNLEKIRRDSFEFTVNFDNPSEQLSVPPLLFIPFVENAVKHGADTSKLSYIHLDFKTTDGDTLHFTCQNSKPSRPRTKNKYGGLGLVNIRRRLELLYNGNFSLETHEDAAVYTVKLSIKNELYHR
jgi:LytS/YehU family sensor histidine kinase